MSEQILLLNPRRRHKHNRHRRKHNRVAPRKKRAHRRVKASSRRRRRVARTGAFYRRRRPRRLRARRHHRTRARKHNRRMRRSYNPRLNVRGIAKEWLIPGAVGALGAVLFEYGWAKVTPKLTWLPTTLQSGWGGTAFKVTATILATLGARRFAPPGLKKPLLIAGGGAVLVTMANALRGAAMSAGVPLSGYVDYQSYALPGARMGAYQPLGGYMPRQTLGDLYSPAAVIQQPGVPVPRQFGDYIAWQPHMGSSGGLMDYNWQSDGM